MTVWLRRGMATRSDSEAEGIVVTFHGVSRPDGLDKANNEPGAARYCLRADRFQHALNDLSPETCCSVAEFLEKQQGDWRILTFDDGLLADFEIVFPLLLEHGARATFFVTADNVGRPGYTSASQLKVMLEAGMEVGSHGLTHRYLVTMSRAEALREINESKRRLEEMLETRVRSFAPVGGHFRRWMLGAAKEAGYSAFATMIPGRTTAKTGFAVLRRNHLQSHHDAGYISKLLQGHIELLLASRVRYSMLSSARRLLGLGAYDRLKHLALRGQSRG